MIVYHTDYDPYAAQGKSILLLFFPPWTTINHSLLPLFPLTLPPTTHLIKAHWKGLLSIAKGQTTQTSFLNPTNLSWFYFDSRKYKICFKAKTETSQHPGWEEVCLASNCLFNVQFLSLLGWAHFSSGPGRDDLLSALCSYCPNNSIHFYLTVLSHHIIMGTGVLSFLIRKNCVPSCLPPT